MCDAKIRSKHDGEGIPVADQDTGNENQKKDDAGG
jgi:hypothetical protein